MKGVLGYQESLALLDYQEVKVKEEGMDHQETVVGGFHANAFNYTSTIHP